MQVDHGTGEAPAPGDEPPSPAGPAAGGALIEDDFVTGTVLHAEGGQLLV
jgi:hypothetical protein